MDVVVLVVFLKIKIHFLGFRSLVPFRKRPGQPFFDIFRQKAVNYIRVLKDLFGWYPQQAAGIGRNIAECPVIPGNYEYFINILGKLAEQLFPVGDFPHLLCRPFVRKYQRKRYHCAQGKRQENQEIHPPIHVRLDCPCLVFHTFKNIIQRAVNHANLGFDHLPVKPHGAVITCVAKQFAGIIPPQHADFGQGFRKLVKQGPVITHNEGRHCFKGNVLGAVLTLKDIFHFIIGHGWRCKQAGQGVSHFQHASLHFPGLARNLDRMRVDIIHHFDKMMHVYTDKNDIDYQTDIN